MTGIIGNKRITFLVILLAICLGAAAFTSLPKDNSSAILAWADKFLPQAAKGSLTAEKEGFVYNCVKEISSAPKINYEAVFSQDKADIWLKRDDSAFGIKLTKTGPDRRLGTKTKSPYLHNGRVVYPDLYSTTVYTPLDDGVREDILIASARDLTKFFNKDSQTACLSWNLEITDNLEAKIEKDGSIGIYGPQQYLWGNISIGDEKSAELIEQARKNAPKTQLLYNIPLPIIIEADGRERKDLARFEIVKQNLCQINLLIKDYHSLRYPISIDPSLTISSTLEFQYAGNDEGMVSISGDQIKRNNPQGGGVGSWTTSGSLLNTARYAHTSVVYKGYLYAIGGSVDKTSVEYTQINAGGTLSSWMELTATPLNTPRGGHGSVVYNGYVYAIGGYNTSSGNLSSVEYAKVNDDDGTLSGWTVLSAAPLNTPRNSHSCVVYNGYLYVIGGSGGTPYLSSVEYARINADGTLGSWVTLTSTPLTIARSYYSLSAYNGYIYAIGGSNGSSLTSVEYARINANGTLGSWAVLTSTPLTTARRQQGSVVYNGYVYVTGGFSSSALNSVEYAKILNTGTIGGWNAASSFNLARYAHTSVTYNGFVYVLGGILSGSWDGPKTETVEYALINPDGTVGTWQYTVPFNTARCRHASVVNNGYIYVIGGTADSGGTALTNVQYAKLSSDGPIDGVWQNATPLTTGMLWHSAEVYNNYLYVIGGTQVRYAQINENGSLGEWQGATPLLPSARAGHTSVVYNGYLYVFNGDPDISDRGIYAQLSPTGGIVSTSWTATTNLVKTTWTASSVVCNGFVYVLGGYDGGPALNNVQYAPINANGSLGSWKSTTVLPAGKSCLAAVAYNGYLYVLGGAESVGVAKDVQYAPIRAPEDGTVGTWTANPTLFTTTRRLHSSAAYNGYLYVIGGDNNGTPLYTVQKAQININGTLTWSSASPLDTTKARHSHSSVVYNGYLYVIGGYNGGYLNTILKTKIDTTNGALIGWNSEGLPVLNPARARHTSAAYNGYLYVITDRPSPGFSPG